jgi:hypothetical protein
MDNEAIDIDCRKWFLSQNYKGGRVVYVNLSSHLKKEAKTLSETIIIIIIIIIFINCIWVVTRWQYTITHKQYIAQHK